LRVSELASTTSQHNQEPGFPTSQLAAELLTLLREAGESIDEDVGHTRDCLHRARRLLAGDQDSAPQGRPVHGSGLAPWQMRRIVRHVEEHLHALIRTEDLAAVARLSVSHFSRAFRDSFEDTPYAYVLGRRVVRAQEMMVSSDDSLAQIALSCGMADQAHFSRLFRRITGESPSRWRRRHAATRVDRQAS
jgi:AraC family transcriptional regulator